MEKENPSLSEIYSINDLVDFKVKKLFANYCEILDEKNNIISYLQGTANLKLFKGQVVRCRIIAINEKRPKIELVDASSFESDNSGLTEEKLSKLIEESNISWGSKEFIKLIMTEEKNITFESQCHKWIQNLINKKVDLRMVREDASRLLELSELLNLCNKVERKVYQTRFTLLIEQVGYYIKAEELIENELSNEGKYSPNEFILDIYQKLKVSGFVYHPNKNFSILSSLFLLRPELMYCNINELLQIICERDIELWKEEPFKSAIVKLLELYIRECDGKIDKTKDNKELINNNLLALCLQLLILKDDKEENPIIDTRLNTARLCTISSYTEHIDIQKLIDYAYYYLFKSDAKLVSYDKTQVVRKYVPHLISSQSPCGAIDTINTYNQSKAKLQISSEGIQLVANSAEKSRYPVFPKELNLWKGLQVYLDSRISTSLSGSKPNDITPFKTAWEEIEFNIFNVGTKPITIASKTKNKHRVNETVKISFIRQDEEDKSKYYCQIEDEIGGLGIIFVKDIVPYTINTALRYFYDSDGSRYVFNARIIDKDGDFWHFSMLEDLKEWLQEGYYSEDEDIICSLGAPTPGYYGMVPAISKEGVSISIVNGKDFLGLNKNRTVKCQIVGKGQGTFHLQCRIIDVTEYDYELSSAFCNLMYDYSVAKIPDNITDEEENELMESDRVLDESYVREVIFLIDRMALLDKDYVKSFNYLGFARILCMLIGWEAQAAYYKGRMDIIMMLHFFAINSKVDEDELDELANVNEELFSKNNVLKDRFSQLQTVSYLGKPNHNDDLFQIAKANPYLKELASLVLSYNITKENKMESVAVDIRNRIVKLLNLKGFESGLKYYGAEDETTEFKTSIVFASGEEDMMPNMGMQMNEILKVISAFMNTKGGTLFVGVNDSGVGVGVESDLCSSLFNGDKDKYKRSVIDAVAKEWGNAATTYIEVCDFDKENTDKDVLIIKINPNLQGLPIDNKWYVRVGSTKRGLPKDEFDEYQKRRTISTPIYSQVETIQEDASQELKEQVEVSEDTSRQFTISKEEGIKTSRIRKNVLFDYLDNYVEPIGFFEFLSDGKFKKLDEYYYDDEESLLTLAVLEPEEKGYLVLAYDNGYVVKVPIEELMDYAAQRVYARYKEAKLMFASIANQKDAILTIFKESKSRSKVLMRMNSIATFEEGKLKSSGEAICNDNLIEEVIAYEVIPKDSVKDFASILDKPKTFSGYFAAPPTKEMIDKLHSWGINEI